MASNNLWLMSDSTPSTIVFGTLRITDLQKFKDFGFLQRVNPYLFMKEDSAYCLDSNTYSCHLSKDNLYFGLDLLNLFGSSECYDTANDRFESLRCAEVVINELAKTSFSFDDRRKIVEQRWPLFASYVINGLASVDIQIDSSFDLNRCMFISEQCKNLGIQTPGFVQQILDCREVAQGNSRVLSLAKKVQRIL